MVDRGRDGEHGGRLGDRGANRRSRSDGATPPHAFHASALARGGRNANDAGTPVLHRSSQTSGAAVRVASCCGAAALRDHHRDSAREPQPPGRSEGAAQPRKQRPRAAKAQLQPFRSCAALVRYAHGTCAAVRGHSLRLSGGSCPFPRAGSTRPPRAARFRDRRRQARTRISPRPTCRRPASTSPTSSRPPAGSSSPWTGAPCTPSTPTDRVGWTRFARGQRHELLLSGDRLLVIANHYAGGVGIAAGHSAGRFARPVTRLTEVDVRDPGELRVVRTQQVGGRGGRLASPAPRPRVVTSPRARSPTRTSAPRRRLAGRYDGDQPVTGHRRTRPPPAAGPCAGRASSPGSTCSRSSRSTCRRACPPSTPTR